MAADISVVPNVPRQALKQQHRKNVPHDSVQDYWKKAIFYPFLDHMISELQCRLITPSPLFELQALLPRSISTSSELDSKMLTLYLNDLSDEHLISTEMKRWKIHWLNVPIEDRPQDVMSTINAITFSFYPNILSLP